MATTFVFCDVDGTINCTPSPTHGQLMGTQDWRDMTAETQGRTFKIWWSNELISAMGNAHRRGKVTLRWLTTWLGDARTELAPGMGLPDFPALPRTAGVDRPSMLWWKWLSLQAFMDEHPEARFAWLDDHLQPDFMNEVRMKYGDRCLLIGPQSNPGITMEDWASVLAFAAKS